MHKPSVTRILTWRHSLTRLVVPAETDTDPGARSEVSELVQVVVGDLSSVDAVDALADAILKVAPRIDVLVNNAGPLQPPRSPLFNLEVGAGVTVRQFRFT